jgi:soluble lytic murein transglycosylase
MPATARDVARRAGIALDDGSLLEPTTNLDLGIRYLAGLVARFKGGAAGAALAVPSYNAGAGSVSRWLTERSGWPLDLFLEAIPYDETRKYAQRVLGRWFVYRWLYAGDLDPGLGVDDRVPYLPLQLPS